MLRDLHDVLAKDASGNEVILGISAIVENKVFAKIGPVLQTEKAFVARSGIRSHNTHTRPETVTDRFSRFFDDTGKLMAEKCRRRNHPSMIALPPHLEVRTAGERHLDTNQEVLGANGGDFNFFNFQIFAAVQDGRHHVSVALSIHGKITNLSESSAG